MSAGITQVEDRALALAAVAPRTRATGRPAVLPSASSAAEAISSATPRTVDSITRPSASGGAPQILEREHPGDADRDVDDAPAPGPAEAVADDHREVGPEPAAVPSRMRAADASGPVGAGSRGRPNAGPTLLASTPAFAHTNPWWVSVISTPCSTAHDAHRLVQTTWIWRASRSQASAQAMASGDGVTCAGPRWRPRPWTRSSG